MQGEGYTEPSSVSSDCEMDSEGADLERSEPVERARAAPTWSRTQSWGRELGRDKKRIGAQTAIPERLEAAHLHAARIHSSKGDLWE